MMNVKCGSCGKLLQLNDNLAGSQMNCPDCHYVFLVERFSTPDAVVPAQLVLAPDPSLKYDGMAHYEALAGHGITPQSAMRTIQDEFPDGEAEEIASDTLTKVQSRLTIDLFLYPLWQTGEVEHGLK